MELWKELLILILSPLAVISAGAYLIRKVLERGLNRDLEKYKNELEMHRFEYQTRFSLIHQKRAEVIGEFYSRLVESEDLLRRLTSVFQPHNQPLPLPMRKDETRAAYWRCKDYFNGHRIYFDEELCLKIDTFLKVMFSAFCDFDTGQDGEKLEKDESGLWVQAWKTVQEKLPPIKTELELVFRKILGSIDNSTSKKE
jgi:hypothetical protein